MNNRFILENYVLDLPQQTDITEDDYVMLVKAGENNGTKIKASDLGGISGSSLQLGNYEIFLNVVDGGPVTTLGIVRDYETGADEYSIFEVEAPPQKATESTITLMRSPDPTRNGPEFVDFYNMAYSAGSTAVGMRIQSRGSGRLLPWKMEWNAGSTRGDDYEIQRLNPNGTFVHYLQTGSMNGPDVNGTYLPATSSVLNPQKVFEITTSSIDLLQPITNIGKDANSRLNVTGLISGSSIQAAHKAANGVDGISTTISFTSTSPSTNHVLVFTNGLLTSYTTS
jgi:hypothetical protein